MEEGREEGREEEVTGREREREEEGETKGEKDGGGRERENYTAFSVTARPFTFLKKKWFAR